MGTKYYFRRVLAVTVGLVMMLSVGSAFGQGKHGRGGGKGWKEGKHEWKDARKEHKRAEKEFRKEQRWADKAWRKAEKRDDRGGGWKRGREDRRPDRSVNYGQIFLGDFWNGGSRGDKSYRKQQKRIWKEERRASKEERKASRRYEREQRRYAGYYNAGRDYNNYGGNYYYNDGRYDDGRSDWKRQLIQVAIANLVGSRLDDGGSGILSQAAPVYGVPVNYGYQSVYGQPSYGNIYRPDYGYGDSPLGGNSLVSGLLSSPLVGELVDRYAGGNGIASQLLGSFLSQGYDQGFLAGRYARQNGYGDDYYRDPYAYQNGVYDPYSVSLGQNRELLGEGYRLGYEDALRNRSEYDPQSDGNTDLVSLLLNNVLGAV